MWGWSQFPVTEGLLGYECGGMASNITTLSLLDVDECDIPPPILNVTTERIQFLQINEYATVHVRQCKIEVRRTVLRCGMHSHVSNVDGGKASYILEISREACERAQQYSTFQVDQVQFAGARPNQTQSFPATLIGWVGTDGSCEGVSYTDPFGSWSSVYVLADIIVTLRDYRARVGLKNNIVYLNSGTRCELSKGQCTDIEGGPTFWDPIPLDKCGDKQYSVLYEGIAQRSINQDSGVLYSLTASDITFALTTLPPVTVCGQVLIRTEHPRLLIHEVRGEQGFVSATRLDVTNMDIFAYVNSKFVYVERHIKTEIQQLYHDVMNHKCSLEREMLKNRLAIATQSPDEFAYQLMKGPGYMAVISGEVVHVVKCVPVEVRVQHLQECYTQLPVVVGNETLFLSPRTHVLMQKGMQINCNRLVPTMYMIEGEWFGLTPGPVRVVPPETMKPMTKPTWRYRNTQSLATSGIYTAADLDQLRDHVMFPAEQPAVLNTMARGLMGKPVVSQGGSIANLLKGPEFNKLMESAWNKAWAKFVSFGHISAGVIGVIMLIRGIKLLIDTIIHGYALHTVYGWSLYLIGAVWDSVTNLLLHLKRGVEKPPPQVVTMNVASETVELPIEQVPPRQDNNRCHSGPSAPVSSESMNNMAPAARLDITPTISLYPNLGRTN